MKRPAFIFFFLLGALLTTAQPQSEHGKRVEENKSRSSVRGRVVYDDTNRPVRRAKVVLIKADLDVNEEPDPGARQLITGTDRNGEFQIQQVEPGRYFVVIESPGVITPLLFAPSDAELAQAVAAGRIKSDFAEVSVDGRTDARVDMRARRGGTITGRAAYADGTPLKGASLQLYRLKDGVVTQLRTGPQGVSTDGRGVYRVAGLPAGEYVIKITERSVTEAEPLRGVEGGYNDASLVFAYHPATSSLKEAAMVRVETGRESTGVDVAFASTLTRTLSGRVLSRRDNSPLEHAKVSIELGEEGYDDSMPTTGVDALTDADGRWSIGGVPDGTYTLTVSRTPYYNEDAEEGAREQSTKSFATISRELKVGSDIEGLTLMLGAGANISGTVVVEGRGPLPSMVRLAAVPSDETPAQAASNQPASQQPSQDALEPSTPLLTGDELWDDIHEDDWVRDDYDSDTGKFHIDSVAEGGVYIYALVPDDTGYYVKALTHKGVDLLRESLRVKEGEEVTGVRVVLAQDSARIKGRALKRDGTSAGSEVEVILIPVEPARRFIYGATFSTTTGTDGRYELSAPPGDYFIFTARSKEHAYTTVTEGDVRAHGSKWPRIALKPRERRNLNVTLREEK